MTTIKQNLGLTNPLKFLNATVISFNASLGLGASSESTLTVDVVEDCTKEESFVPADNPNIYGVGMPVYFPDNPEEMPNFKFGGVLHSWTAQKSSSGLTYSVVVKDPRQLLENTLIIIDSLITGPIYHINYYNVYAYWEQAVIYSNNCFNYGLSESNQKGMPYYKIIETLNLMNIKIYPATYSSYPYAFNVDFGTFPGVAAGTRTLPLWYRVPGPGISILQLLEDICNVLAYEFYVYLEYDQARNMNVIKIGLIDLNNPPSSFSSIINALESVSTDISYGQEFRNEKSKMVLVGDSVHYLVPTNTFDFFFGEDVYGTNLVPIVPYYYDDCGFWINKKIESLNLSLDKPFPSNGPYTISELDIRSAMSSYEMWVARTFDTNTPGGFNSAIRLMYPSGIANTQEMIDTFASVNGALNNTQAIAKNLADGLSNPADSTAYRNRPDIVNELKKMHNFLNSLGSTYYGKQFITQLNNQKVCKKYNEETGTYVYSDTPTNNGGWLDNSYSILGLTEPDLSQFRTDDQRIQGFAQFTLTYSPNVINSTVEGNRATTTGTQFSRDPDILPSSMMSLTPYTYFPGE